MKRILLCSIISLFSAWLLLAGLNSPTATASVGAVLQPATTTAYVAEPFIPNPAVVAMLTQVNSSTLYSRLAQLSGEASVIIDGAPYTITSRNTNSGVPIQKATQYVYEQLQSWGLGVSYHNWTGCSVSNRNVIGVLTGTVKPNEIVLITAHMDDMPSSGSAPGADDNGSGTIGVLMAADLMRQYSFERTIRFVLFTGEEQGLCGSAQYANLVNAAGDNIVAVYNMDMIAYDAVNGPTLRLHTRTTSNSGYTGDVAIAGVFTNVVASYGLSGTLTPIIDADGESASDHASFWSKGYSALLAIEDDANDFNAYYHTSNDRLANINLIYFTNFVKASLGTAAHLARPLAEVGTLTGSVTDASSGQPIGNAQISATASVTQTVGTTSNVTGTYALLLAQNTYTVTAAAYGYEPSQLTGIVVVSGTTTTQNITLTPASYYVLSGTVRDAVTGWPLTATLSIAGYPTGTVATDPATGFYSVTLAGSMAYAVTVNSAGYTAATRTVGPLSADRTEDFALNADLAACTAPGYTFVGVTESFTATSLPVGWTVINNVGSVGWLFNNPLSRSNLTGGTGNFAMADSDYAGSGVSMNTELRTPQQDFSSATSVMLRFKTDFRYYTSSQAEVADVDVSQNGADGPWINVWRKTADYRGPKTEAIDLTALAAGQAKIMVRFHYYNAVYEWWWQVDDVQLGSCRLPATHAPNIMPISAAQSTDPGKVVTYTLTVSNTDETPHAITVGAINHAWPLTATAPSGVLDAHTSAPFTVTVQVPVNAVAASSDFATIFAALADNPIMSATAQLTTTAHWSNQLYLPVILRP